VIILGVAGLYGEYCAFKGVGDASSKMMRRFLFLQAAIAFVQMLFSVLKLVNWNGWMRMEEAAASVEAGPFWYYGTIVEASIFTLGYFVAGVAVWYMYTVSEPRAVSTTDSHARARAPRRGYQRGSSTRARTCAPPHARAVRSSGFAPFVRTHPLCAPPPRRCPRSASSLTKTARSPFRQRARARERAARRRSPRKGHPRDPGGSRACEPGVRLEPMRVRTTRSRTG
jgi:hypothetical protein